MIDDELEDDTELSPANVPTVVDVSYNDGDEYTYVFGQTGCRIAFWPRMRDCTTEQIALVPEVAALENRRLVDQVSQIGFRDGSAPFRLLDVPHRFVDAHAHRGAPRLETLDDVNQRLEIFYVETVE